MYYLTIRQFVRTLKNLDAVLDKAAQHAKAHNFDVNNFCTSRLFVDMLPFPAQIRIACDMAKAAGANLAGKEAPKFEDNEATFAQLRERIAKTIAYLDTLNEKDFEKTTAQTVVKIPFPQGKALSAEEYLLARQVPNFFFHVTTAYDILRAGGIPLSKNDYIGALNLLPGG
jgi:uncharacterized protein